MFKRAMLAFLIIVTLSAVTLTVFAISVNDKNVNPEIQPTISPSSSVVTLKDRVELKYPVYSNVKVEYKTTDRVKHNNLQYYISNRSPENSRKIYKRRRCNSRHT